MLCLFWCHVHSFFLTGLIIFKDWNIKSELPNQEVLIATFNHSFLKEDFRLLTLPVVKAVFG